MHHHFQHRGLPKKTACRLSNPLIGYDGRVYTCSERNLFAFERNGSISWTVPLNYTCNVGIAPVHGDRGKIYLVAENRVMKINPSNIGTTESAAEVFFGPEPGQEMDICAGVLDLCFIDLATVKVVSRMLKTVIFLQSQ